MWKALLVDALFLALQSTPTAAQVPNPKTAPPIATVTFSWALWNANPSQYTIVIDSIGNMTYISQTQSTAQTGVPYSTRFLASAFVRQTVFNTVEKLNYLDLSYRDGPFSAARRSVTTISFCEGEIHHQISFHSSTNPQVRKLTLLFESISKTLELGRHLGNFRGVLPRKLAVELQHMQSIRRGGILPGLPAVRPILQDILAGRNLGRNIRSRAKAILNST